MKRFFLFFCLVLLLTAVPASAQVISEGTSTMYIPGTPYKKLYNWTSTSSAPSNSLSLTNPLITFTAADKISLIKMIIHRSEGANDPGVRFETTCGGQTVRQTFTNIVVDGVVKSGGQQVGGASIAVNKEPGLLVIEIALGVNYDSISEGANLEVYVEDTRMVGTCNDEPLIAPAKFLDIYNGKTSSTVEVDELGSFNPDPIGSQATDLYFYPLADTIHVGYTVLKSGEIYSTSVVTDKASDIYLP